MWHTMISILNAVLVVDCTILVNIAELCRLSLRSFLFWYYSNFES
jgi:hypothetical protein